MQTDNAFAAKILFQVSGKFNSSFQDTLALCGDKEPQLYTISVNIKQFSTTEWDNGHFLHTEQRLIKFYDSAGTLIAQQSNPGIQIVGTGGLPESLSGSQVVTCTGASKDPGQSFNLHFGLTLGSDGQIKEFHHVCMPTGSIDCPF